MTAAGAIDGRRSRREARLARLRAAAFRAARRHTWQVKALRLLLPAIGTVLLVGYGALLYGRFSAKLAGGQLTVDTVVLTADDFKMKGVTYDGATKDGGRYVVRAREAQVDIMKKGPVALTAIVGDLTQQSGVVTKLTSRRGILDNTKGEMDLLDGVTIDSSNGLKARMKSAKVFNKDNRVVAKEGVDADTATGRIKAQSMDFETKSRKGIFEGNVAVRMTPDSASTKSPLGGLGGGDAKQPLDMTSQKLDIDDTARLAVFTGGVTAVQGDSQMTAQALRVTYEGRAAVPGLPTAVPAAGSADGPPTRLSKLQANGQVVITQGADRRVIAETMDVDVAADTAIFTGPTVEVQQGKNRLLGRRLEIDRKSGRSRLSSPAEGRTPAGRIKTTLVQDQKATSAPIKGARPAGSSGVDTVSGGLMNFKTDPNAPIDIEAETLDVNDQTKQAVFRKAVRAQQGDFVIQSAELVATYAGDTGLLTTGDPSPQRGQSAQITRIEATTDVVITSKDGQEARGKKAVFEQKANTVILTGDVVVKQDRTIITGTRLAIDLATGIANFENDGSQPSIGSALAPASAQKSAAGPGGLPQVGGILLPVAPAPAGSGRQSITLYPEDFKKQQEAAKAARAARGEKPAADKSEASPRPVPRVTPKAAAEGWQATTSPSPIYRAP